MNYDNYNNYYNNNNDNGGSSNYETPNNNDKGNKNNKKLFIIGGIILGVLIVAVLASIIVGVIENSVSGVIEQKEETTTTGEYSDIGQTEISTNESNEATGIVMTDASTMVENVMPSVVAITSTTVQEMYGSNYYNDIFEYYFGYGYGDDDGYSDTYEEAAAGSGIILDQSETELLIVTNNHVVEGADELSIRFYGQSDEEGVKGYIKGTSPENDVAVVAVKLEDIPSEILKNIKKATIGDSDTVKVGEGVIAIGNALGYGQSVTAGIISATDRSVTLDNQEMKLIQTDAAINGGNSGGALINAKGEVIGINVAKYSATAFDTSSIEGMGFAIPISSVKDVISELENMKTKEEVAEGERGYLGIEVGDDVDSETSEKYNMPVGVFVKKVVKGGPADQAGIVAEDIIRKFDGQTIQTYAQLQDVMQYYRAGEKVKVTIAYRDGREYVEKEVEVTLGDSTLLE